MPRRPGGRLRRSGTHSSMTKRPPGSRWRAAFSNTAIWRSWVSTLLMPLKTRKTRRNVPSTRGRHVAGDDGDHSVVGLGAELVDHRLAELDAGDGDARFGE